MATERVSGHICLGGPGLLLRATAAHTHARTHTHAHTHTHQGTHIHTQTEIIIRNTLSPLNKHLLLSAHTHTHTHTHTHHATIYALTAPPLHPLSAGFSPKWFPHASPSSKPMLGISQLNTKRAFPTVPPTESSIASPSLSHTLHTHIHTYTHTTPVLWTSEAISVVFVCVCRSWLASQWAGTKN